MNFSKKQWLAIQYLEASNVERVLWGGAAFGGKTWTLCLWQINRRLKYPGTVGLIGRKTLIDLKKTTLLTFQRIYSQIYEPKYGAVKYDGQRNLIEFPNGSVIFLIDTAFSPADPEFTRLGSYELTDSAIDEAGESSQRSVDIIFSRTRFKLINDKPAQLLCSNPVSNWLKWNWVKDQQGKEVILPDHCKYIKATIDDNPDREKADRYKQTLERLPLTDRQRLLYGDWDYVQNDSPFITEFNEEKQVGDFIIDESYPLWLTFDFNIDPCTCLLFQEKRDGVYFLKEVQVRGGTGKLCQELKLYMSHKNAIFVTGDRSGNSGSTSAGIDDRSLITDYTIIKKELRLNDFAFKHNKNANKQLEYSRRLVNYAFRNTNICFDRSMVQTIQDIKNAKVDENEKLVKDRQTYKLDCFDAMRYGINAIFPKGINDIDRKRIMHN